MKAKRVLITGGAGFVGSHTADALLAAGHQVRIFDNLTSQVHHDGQFSYIPKFAEFVLGDMRNKNQVEKAVQGIDVIFHLAAAVGVGQSMYQIADYTATNNLGTANLFQAILDTRSEPEKIVEWVTEAYSETDRLMGLLSIRDERPRVTVMSSSAAPALI